ncbi:UvrD-helicase domain-containing protein [candidate division KSB1 bacterium]|nr:UvrD-helicase domain-containing protein [candidate division KSB1 bacterium]
MALSSVEDILGKLNPVQREAVEYNGGPILILAGAGSGKTRVITHKIAYIIATRQAKPWEILALTFTNKAAGEMKERIRTLVGKGADLIWMGTFHSIFARILRKEGERIGLSRNFTIYDEEDQQGVIKGVMKELDLSAQELTPRTVRSRINRAKDALLGPGAYAEGAEDFIAQRVAQIYSEYEKRLQAANALDFADLLLKPVRMFRSHPDLLGVYQKQFSAILVDEYQDTNHAQSVLTDLLAARHRNICVVGDDDQSIYSWRGADVGNILGFEQNYPNCKIFRLEQNYRSTKTILGAAGAVVSHNRRRKPKTLWTSRGDGEVVTLMKMPDEREEVLGVVRKIETFMAEDKRQPRDFAVLYRTNAQSRGLEEGLRRAGIPYTIVGGIRFYERREIKDVLAYLRVVVNPQDDFSLLRIINVPPRGIGAVTLSRLKELARQQGLSLFGALKLAGEEVSILPEKRKRLKQLNSVLKKYGSSRKKVSPGELARGLLDDVGYWEYLEQDSTPKGEDRVENVKELLRGMEEFSTLHAEGNLEAFLAEVSLLTDIDSWDDRKNGVTMMTLHAAKGLEFPVVFITGLEEGLFPLASNLDDPAQLEEERRLFYVGATRAEERLLLSCAFRRRRFGGQYGIPSRFIDEVPTEYLETEGEDVTWGAAFSPEDITGTEKTYQRIEDEYSMGEEGDFRLKVGQTVHHSRFGRGRILGKSGFGEMTRLVVDFEKSGRKRLLLKYAHLQVLYEDEDS